MNIARILAIGGSDPSGGAGIQADLKTITELGAFAYTAISAITAQNSSNVRSVDIISALLLKDQLNSVAKDSEIAAIKTGMLGSSENILAVVDFLKENPIRYVVVDPVIKASDGTILTSDAGVAVLKKRLIPKTFMVTPNIDETSLLTGITIHNDDDLTNAAHVLKEAGAEWILIKGGHMDSPVATDLLFDGTERYFFEALRAPVDNVRGTGCMMASAIAAFLVRGLEPFEAVDKAKAYVYSKIKNAVKIGSDSLQALHTGCMINQGGIYENRSD